MADNDVTKTHGTRREKHRELYEETNINRRECKRVVPMEALSLGMSRTGTMSIKMALDILGLRCYHYISAMANPPDFEMWTAAFEAKYLKTGKPFERAEWDQLLGHVGAVSDAPANCFPIELADAYPEAKIILVQRDADKWFKSYNDAVITNSQNPFVPLGSWLDPVFLGPMAGIQGLICRFVFGCPNGYRDAKVWRANARQAYKDHYDYIRANVAKERILEYELGSGWEPICKHLGKPIPDVPFPRVNETAVVTEKVNLTVAKSFKRSAWNYGTRLGPILVLLLGVLIMTWI